MTFYNLQSLVNLNKHLTKTIFANIFFYFQTLANSAATGILIGLFSAWAILILTTFNYVIGTLALITIGLVTACVVGMIPLAGWKLGVRTIDNIGKWDNLLFPFSQISVTY